VSAPAGFGKSTLLSAWAQEPERRARVAWLSLDKGENDLARFLAYMVAALRTVEAGLGKELVTSLQSPGAIKTDLLLTSLLNDIAALPDQLILVLDDYHVIESRPVDEAVAFCLDHLPPQFHLVIASRIDPTLPLSRYRARGQMTEVRADDLRFTPDEVSAFLNQTMGFNLSIEETTALETRTEGWIVGLQMAALSISSLEQANEINDFINRFTGGDHYIQDYLTEEVLQRQPADIRDFLLLTAILDRLSASVCDAVTGRDDSQVILENLEASNLFLSPLDNERTWYRYHHLFADLLRQRLQLAFPDRLDELNARASHWLESNGFTRKAIAHALVMEDKRPAADLIERHTINLLYGDHSQDTLTWFASLPDELFKERPMLGISRAWALVFNDPFRNRDLAMQSLAQARQAMAESDAGQTLARTIKGHAFSIQAILSHPPIKTDHEPGVVLELLHEAQALLPPDETFIRSDNYISIGYEYLHLEAIESAQDAFMSAFAEARRGNNHLVALVAIRNQALIAYYTGELTRAIEICQQGITEFEQFHIEDDQTLPGLSILSVALGFMLLEQGAWEKAEFELAKGFDTLQWFGEYEAMVLGLTAFARLSLIKGDDKRTLRFLDRFGQQWPSTTPLVETLRIQIEMTRLARDAEIPIAILTWMKENQPVLDADTDITGISPWNETQHLTDLTWIQSQISTGRWKSESGYASTMSFCLELLERCLQGAQQRGVPFRVIECSILKSLVLHALGNAHEAISSLSSAVSLAEPEGYRRVFLDKGPLLTQLLRELSANKPPTDFARQLLTGIEAQTAMRSKLPRQELPEPLTPRELEVLRLVADGLSNREIGERLFLALNSVKGHNYRAFGKLEVRSRTEAIARARELGLI
jgi:LuxR family maltose regulon positive regulatory protein